MTAATWKPTQAQRDMMRKLWRREALGLGWYRAESHGERVTLASLHRLGIAERQAWRGREGEPDAAHEYRATPPGQ